MAVEEDVFTTSSYSISSLTQTSVEITLSGRWITKQINGNLGSGVLIVETGGGGSVINGSVSYTSMSGTTTATITGQGLSPGTEYAIPECAGNIFYDGARLDIPTRISFTTLSEQDDTSFLNKRGLAYFWGKIDDKKQNKLTPGSNITISGDTISASQPTVNNGTLTIQKNGTNVQTFTANQGTNATANITVPEIKKRTGATTTTDITPLYVAGDGTTTTPMALKTHGDAHTGSFAYVNINEPTNDISEAYIGGYVWDEYEEWWRKMSEKKLALYSDIPTVNNATLTIQKNGTTVQTFTANASSNVTANITVPTQTSDLTNDSGFVDATAIAGKQDLLTAGDHINITGTTIKAVDYVHSEQPVATQAVTPVVTGSMISNGTITADKLASGATVQLTLSNVDIGEGSALAANTLYGVYQ